MSHTDFSLDLDTRSGLPDSLRILTKEYPQDMWESHDRFDGLVRFWLERHMMFRKLGAMLQADALKLEEKVLAPNLYRQRVGKLGNMFVGELHAHHSIEDHQYFPLLQKIEPRLGHGFEVLEHDHHALDRHLETFTNQANSLLQSKDNEIDGMSRAFHEGVIEIEGFLNRHLTDEEELVVPIILKHGLEI